MRNPISSPDISPRARVARWWWRIRRIAVAFEAVFAAAAIAATLAACGTAAAAHPVTPHTPAALPGMPPPLNPTVAAAYVTAHPVPARPGTVPAVVISGYETWTNKADVWTAKAVTGTGQHLTADCAGSPYSYGSPGGVIQVPMPGDYIYWPLSGCHANGGPAAIREIKRQAVAWPLAAPPQSPKTAVVTSDTAGAGIAAFPLCRSTPLQPGHATTLNTNGNIPGAQVTNTGTAGEDLALSVTSDAGRPPGIQIPASWVTTGSADLAPNQSAVIPVTVTPPASAQPGTYVAGVAVSTKTGTGNVQLGTAAESWMAFTIGIRKPAWTRAQIATAVNCWVPPPNPSPWQEAYGTAYRNPPPGFHQIAAGVWIYDPPPGWKYDRHGAAGGVPRQVYRGGHPVVQCASPALWPARAGGDMIGGAGMPDTSTPAGCAAWLAASKAGTLTAEPVLGSPASVLHQARARATPAAARLAAAVKPARQGSATEGGLLFLVIGVVGAVIAWYFIRRRKPW